MSYRRWQIVKLSWKVEFFTIFAEGQSIRLYVIDTWISHKCLYSIIFQMKFSTIQDRAELRNFNWPKYRYCCFYTKECLLQSNTPLYKNVLFGWNFLLVSIIKLIKGLIFELQGEKYKSTLLFYTISRGTSYSMILFLLVWILV